MQFCYNLSSFNLEFFNRIINAISFGYLHNIGTEVGEVVLCSLSIFFFCVKLSCNFQTKYLIFHLLRFF